MRQQGRRSQRGGQLPRSGSAGSATVVALVFFALLAVLGAFTRVAWTILGVDVAVSGATVLAYRSDKLAAQQGRWRTQESALHVMALLGGWPGALAAQQLYRHKTKKRSFQAIFWLTVIGNLLVLAWLIATSGFSMGGRHGSIP